MMGEIVVMGLLVVAIVLAVYLVTREPKRVVINNLPPVSLKVPMLPVKPTYTAPAERPVYKAGKASQVKSSSGSRSQYPSGGSTTHQDTSSTDLLTTVLILDAIDDSSNYVEPSVDTYSAPSYSSPTPSSYSDSSSSSYSSSSYDDSSSRSSSYSSSSSSSSSDYSSSSDSSSSSSSYD